MDTRTGELFKDQREIDRLKKKFEEATSLVPITEEDYDRLSKIESREERKRVFRGRLAELDSQVAVALKNRR